MAERKVDYRCDVDFLGPNTLSCRADSGCRFVQEPVAYEDSAEFSLSATMTAMEAEIAFSISERKSPPAEVAP
jgi:hypothetical protein